MAVANRILAQLSDADRRRVESWLTDFDRGWHDGRLAEEVGRLPPAQVGMELRADVQSVGHTLFEEGLSSREG